MIPFEKNIKPFLKKALFAINSFGRETKFAAARVVYRAAGYTAKRSYAHPRDIGLIAIDPEHNTSPIGLPPNYAALVETIAQGIHAKLGIANACLYTISDPATRLRLDRGQDLPTSTWEVPEFKAGQIQMIRTKACHDIPGIETLAQALMPEIEKHIYGSFVEVASSFGEIKFFTEENKNKDGLFHSDRHYEDTVRLIVYLSDVDDDSAPFEYLRHKEHGGTIRIKTADHPLRTRNGRIPPELLNEYLTTGYERVRVTGKKGTAILFDSKIVHRANSPKKQNRMVLVLPIRPALQKSVRYVDPANVEGVYV